MKKMIPFIIITIIIIGGILFISLNKKTYKEINLKTVEEKINNKDSFVLYIGSSECSACERFKPILNQVINDYKVTVYYIDVHKFSEVEYNKFLTLVNFGESTPAVYFIEDGEYLQMNAIKGFKNYDYVVEKMIRNGIIEK